MVLPKTIKPSKFAVLLFLHAFVLLAAIINWRPDAWFLGWDSINSELNIALNITRTFTALWQENYGTGLLGGHGFAALLPHALLVSVLSLAVPDNVIRLFFTFLSWYLGGLGMYVLGSLLIRHLPHRAPFAVVKDHPWISETVTLLSALFYLGNLGTVQIFFVQLEAFIVHFAVFPWLLWATLLLLERVTWKRILLFAAISFAGSAQGFIPSLFLSTSVSVGIVCIAFLVSHRFSRPFMKRVFLILSLIITTNAYWLVPVGYFTMTRVGVTSQAYNNLISTPEFADKSIKYGSLANVALLKSFLWESYELSDYVLKDWRQHYSQPAVQMIGYGLFGMALAGLGVILLRIRSWIFVAVAGIFVYFFASLAIDTFPFSLVAKILSSLSPTYEQAFRTTFTKFGIGTALSYSMLILIGTAAATGLLVHVLKRAKRATPLMAFAGVCIVYYSLPLFSGNMLYDKLFVTLPPAYTDIIDYFKTQPDGRIADLPQDCPEGWYGYTWGYFGSGFYWYGIRQPFLSRSFDVWSQHNENYYWELTQAIRTKNYVAADNVLTKFNVRWILFDPNFIHCRNQKAFTLTEDFVSYLRTQPSYHAVKTFESEGIKPLELFERIVPDETSFVTFAQSLPEVSPQSNYMDEDIGLASAGQYALGTSGLIFPFRSLMTKRTSVDWKNQMEITERSLIVSQTVKTGGLTSMTIPAYTNQERYLPAVIEIVKNTNRNDVFLTFLLPELYIDSIPVVKNTSYLLGSFPGELGEADVYGNGALLSPNDGKYATVFFTTRENTLEIISGTSTVFSWNDAGASVYQSIFKDQTIPVPAAETIRIEAYVPKEIALVSPILPFNPNANPPVPCGESIPSGRNKYEIGARGSVFLRMISQDSRQCFTHVLPSISTEQSYILAVTSRHVSGLPLRLHVLNKNRQVGLDVYLPDSGESVDSYLIIPSGFPQEVGLDLVFENASLSSYPSINELSGIRLYYLPRTYLMNIFLGQKPQPSSLAKPKQVIHPNETSYYVTAPEGAYSHIILYQGYDAGWSAYKVRCDSPGIGCQIKMMLPFLFGKPLSDHILINNWANGWKTEADASNNTTYVLYFWPQLLGWLGFALLLAPFFIALASKRHRR